MGNRLRLSVCASLFLFLFFCSSVFAYTEFGNNPSFTTGITGYTFYSGLNQTYNSSFLNISYNATCFGTNKTSCLSFQNYYAAINAQVRLGNANVNNTNVYTNNTTYNSNYDLLTLPAYQEGIVTLSYRVNETWSNGVYPYPYPTLFAIELSPSYNPSYYVSLNDTNGTWFNYTILIPATNYEREFEVFVDFDLHNNNTQLMIDYFRFYTVDLTTFLNLWSTNSTESLETFCGPLAQFSHVFAADGEPYYNQVNATKAYLFATLDDVGGTYNTNLQNKSACAAFMLGNLTVVSRFDLYNYFNASTAYTATNDERSAVMGYAPSRSLMWFNPTGRYDLQEPSSIDLIEAIGTTSMTLTHFYNHSANNQTLIVFGNLGSTNLTLEKVGKNNTGALRQSIDFTSYLSNGLPTGTTFRIYSQIVEGGNVVRYTPLFNIFSSNLTGVGGWYCTDNAEAYYLNNGTVSNGTYDYCGNCGCNATSSRCNTNPYNALGSVCDSADLTLRDVITYFDECATPLYSSCPEGTACTSYTSRNPPANQTGYAHLIVYGPFETVACLNLTSSEQELCIDENANQINCSSIIAPTSFDYCVNKDGEAVLCSSFHGIEWFALWLGGFLSEGIGADLNTAETLLGLYIAIGLGFAGLFIARRNKNAVNVFALLFLSGIGFSLIAIPTTYLIALFVVFAITTVGLLSGFLKNLVSGGK